MLAAVLVTLWRWTMAICDWRAHWRFLSGRPMIDVAIITNVRDEQEKHLFWGCLSPRDGHSSGARIYMNGVAGRVRGIYVTAAEMMSKSGRQLAKQQFINAVKWADQRGAKVVLLAASTKRLFGRDGAELKALFPHILFTIGDNGTSLLLCQDIAAALSTSKLSKQSRVLVIGPYGILGTEVTRFLLAQGYEVVGFGSNPKLLNEFASSFPIELHSEITKIGKVDAVFACTHSPDAKLTAENVEYLRHADKKLLVVDVAEPANLDLHEYQRCEHVVVRQDAGNAFSPELNFVLGRLSSGMLNLPPNSVFGCFAEALTLYRAVYLDYQHTLLNQDWFQINRLNLAVLAHNFTLNRVAPTAPVCFGQPVENFELKRNFIAPSARQQKMKVKVLRHHLCHTREV